MTKGYDKLSVNEDILLDFPLREMTGLLTYDVAKPHHLGNLVGPPTWNSLLTGLPYLYINLNNRIWCTGADLNFTAGDFSGCIWLRTAIGLITYEWILGAGILSTNGWLWRFNVDGLTFFHTSQAAATQISTSDFGDVALDQWAFHSFSRKGASVRIYHNGVDYTLAEGTHLNPAASIADFTIGANFAGTGDFFEGSVSRPRVWSRYLEQREWLEIFNHERHWFGV